MRLAPELTPGERARSIFREYQIGAILASHLQWMAGQQPPTWDDIRSLIERADEVCRESEYLRAQAERARHRRDFWPERRQPARKHGRQDVSDRRQESGSPPLARKGTP